MAATCGSDIWQRHVAVTYGSDMWQRTCGSDMWQRHMAATCGSDIWQRHVAATCGSDMLGSKYYFLKDITVAYKKCFRISHILSPRYSASDMFATNYVKSVN